MKGFCGDITHLSLVSDFEILICCLFLYFLVCLYLTKLWVLFFIVCKKIALRYEQGLYRQWAFSLTHCIKETDDILGVEYGSYFLEMVNDDTYNNEEMVLIRVVEAPKKAPRTGASLYIVVEDSSFWQRIKVKSKKSWGVESRGLGWQEIGIYSNCIWASQKYTKFQMMRRFSTLGACETICMGSCLGEFSQSEHSLKKGCQYS